MKRLTTAVALLIFLSSVLYIGTKPVDTISSTTTSTTVRRPEGPRSMYFEDWYAPFETWSPKMQNDAVAEILALPDDRSVTYRDKYGREINSATEPWVQKGPTGIAGEVEGIPTWYSGRVSALDHQPAKGLFVGAANGGLWMPDPPAMAPISDQLPTQSTGSFAVHPTNPAVIYLGTGEYQEIPGTGAYRTTNSGAHWDSLSLSPTPSFVSRVLIAPWDEHTVFVAGNTGIHKSTDDGISWTQVFSKNTSDLAASQSGFYMLAGALNNGVYKSEDYGSTWQALIPPYGGGLPADKIGRISVTISPSLPSRAYVQIGKPKDSAGGDSVRGVYRTTDYGLYWQDVTPAPSELSGKNNYLGQQGYNNVITVHPLHPDTLWVGGVYLMRSFDAGDTWQDVGATGGGPRYVHPDIHVLKYVGDRLYVGCDGGVFFTNDEGAHWNSSINPFLPITQFYNIGVELNGGRIKYGGTQDNGCVATTITLPEHWILKVGGDGIEGAVNPQNSNEVYMVHNGPGENWRKQSLDGGINWSSVNEPMQTNGENSQKFWHTYVEISPGGNRVFTNSANYTYWSTNSGLNWLRMKDFELSGIVGQISSNSNGTFVYAPVGNDPERLFGYSYVVGNNTWQLFSLYYNLPNRAVRRVCPSFSDPDVAHALLGGIGHNEKIFRTTDRGQHWTNVTGDLPDLPVDDMIDFNGRLYLGTDKGAFLSTNGGTNWIRWNAGMPVGTRVSDLEVMVRDAKWYIVAGTYGRSTFERPVTGTDPLFFASKLKMYFRNITAAAAQTDCVYVSNPGGAVLEISSIVSNRPDLLAINPTSGMIPPAESLKIMISMSAPFGGPAPASGLISADIEFHHDGPGGITRMLVEGYAGDDTPFRSFTPESLVVKKEVKRKTATTAWCFNFDNSTIQRNGAKALYVEFKKSVLGFGSNAPFMHAENIDGRGKKWLFSDGIVGSGNSAVICGTTKKTQLQEVKKWWWIADLVVWDGDQETTEEGILGEEHGKKLPGHQAPGLDMPNTANFRKEIFEQVPFSKTNPLVVGVADPAARSKEVAYVALKKHKDVWNSLAPRRDGARHNGPPDCFDKYLNGRKMKGRLSSLKPNKQSNRLFAELVALKLNIYGSATGKVPVGFGELRYTDPGSRFDGLMVKQIDSLANIFMTYCDTSGVGDPVGLDSVVRKINAAFTGPVDTVSFASALEFTSVRPVGNVAFLERDPSIEPARIIPDYSFAEIPDEFELYQNYPNPFNPTTTIEFELPEPALVTLSIYNILGQAVGTPLDREYTEDGLQEVEFDAGHLPSGVYFYRIVAEPAGEDGAISGPESVTAVRKMVLIR